MLTPTSTPERPALAAPKAVVFDFVNALRGVAAWLVFYFHLHVHTFHNYPAEPIASHSFTHRFIFGDFDLGKYAVGVFFIISGFLIPTTLRGPNAALSRFATHRFFRLFPAYWVSIALFLLFQAATGGLAQFNGRQILANLTMLQRFLGQEDLIGVFWTLQIELIFYVLCALLFAIRLMEKRFLILASALGLGLLMAGAKLAFHKNLPVAIPIALALMFFGDILHAHDRGDVGTLPIRLAYLAVATLLIPICLIGYPGEGLRYVLTYEASLATFALAFRFRHAFSRHAFVRRAATFLGDITYSVYLLQFLGIALAAAIFHRGYGRLASTCVGALATLLLAWIVFALVEAPCIRLGRSLRDRRRPALSADVR